MRVVKLEISLDSFPTPLRPSRIATKNKEHTRERGRERGREGTTDIPARTQVGPQGTSGNAAAAAAAVITRKREGEGEGEGETGLPQVFSVARSLPPSLPPCAPRPPLSTLVPHSTKCGYEAKIHLRTIQTDTVEFENNKS